MERRNAAIKWLDSGGFELTALLDHRREPAQWGVLARDLRHNSREPPCPSQSHAYPTTCAALLPHNHTVLTAGVIHSHGPDDTPSLPRSVLVTVSSPAPHHVDSPDAQQDLRHRDGNSSNDSAQHQPAIHIWAVEARPCLGPAPRTPAPGVSPSGDTNSGPHAYSHAHHIMARPQHEVVSTSHGPHPVSTAVSQQIALSLHEIARTPLPQDVSAAENPSTCSGTVGPRQQHSIVLGRANGHGIEAAASMAATAATYGGWRCHLAHRGAWAALQAFPAQVLLLGFAAALDSSPPLRLRPPYPDLGFGPDTAGTASTMGQGGTTRLHCLDVDLSTMAAPALAEGLSLNSCQKVSCCGDARGVVLDVALSDAAGAGDADADNGNGDAGANGVDGKGEAGHSLLLRIGFLFGSTEDGPSGYKDEVMAGSGRSRAAGVAGTTEKMSPVQSRASGAAAASVAASVGLRGQISACCQLPSLTQSGSSFMRFVRSQTTGSGTASGAAAAILNVRGPPALIGSVSGRVYLVAPCLANTWVSEQYPNRGAGGGPQAGGLAPGRVQGDPLQESSLALTVVAQLHLPGPVDSVHPLPRILHSSSVGSSYSGHGGTGGDDFTAAGGGLDRIQPALQQLAHGGMGSITAFAAVLCSDAARNVIVLRVLRCQRPEDATPKAAAGVISMVPASSLWFLQQLLVVPAIQAVLPVPLPSALSLALAPPRSGHTKGQDGSGSCREDGFGRNGSGADWDREGAVLVSPAAVLVLGTAGATEEGSQRGQGGHREGLGLDYGHDCGLCSGAGQDEDVDADVDMVDADGGCEPERVIHSDSEDNWRERYMQRQRLHHRQQHKHGHQRQQDQWRRRQQVERADNTSGGMSAGALPVWGPVSLGPWSRALVLPGEVQPLPPQALLGPGSPTNESSAPPFAAGAVTGVLHTDLGHDTFSLGAGQQRQQPQRGGLTGRNQELEGGLGGVGAGTGGGCHNAQDAGMAKVLAHLSRRWDAGVRHNLEQRATLGRMVHLTRQVEQLIADVGQQPLRNHGSAGAQSHATLLDPCLVLEDEFRRQQQQRDIHLAAHSHGSDRSKTLEGAGDGGHEGSGAMDHLFDQLLGDGEAAGMAPNTADGVTAATAHNGSAPDAMAMWRESGSAAGVRASGWGGSAAASEPWLSNEAAWSPALESLKQTRQGSDWILRAVLRLDTGHGVGSRECNIGNADWNGNDGNDCDGSRRSAGGRAPPASSQGVPRTAPSPLSLHLDDVSLFLYCPAGLPLTSIRGRWTVLQRGLHRMAVEAVVPLWDVLGLAAVAAKAARDIGYTGSGAGQPVFDICQRRDLQVALGPQPGLFEPTIGYDDDDDDDGTHLSSSSSSSSDSDRTHEGYCARDDMLGDRDSHGGGDPGRMDDACRSKCWGRDVELGAVVRITARTPGPNDALCDSDHRGLVQVRVLDVGRVRVPIDSLLRSTDESSKQQQQQQKQQIRQQQQQQQQQQSLLSGGGGKSARMVSSDCVGMPSSTPHEAATGSLLVAPSRSVLLVSVSEEAAAAEGRRPAGMAPVAAANGGGRMAPCQVAVAEAACAPQRGEAQAAGSMCNGLRRRLLSAPGFRTLKAQNWALTGVPEPGLANIDDHISSGPLLWEGPLGWRCVAALQRYGVYGCEVELSYMEGGYGGPGCYGLSGAALDQIQWLVTEAAERWCEQVGRRLSVLYPNPIAEPQLEYMDVAAGALQRCIDATLELLEATVLAQHQEQEQQQQVQHRVGRMKLGPKLALQNGAPGDGGTEAVVAVGRSGSRLQAMLQEVLQLQLQLSTAMETYLVP